jgi:hypothetical protein
VPWLLPQHVAVARRSAFDARASALTLVAAASAGLVRIVPVGDGAFSISRGTSDGDRRAPSYLQTAAVRRLLDRALGTADEPAAIGGRRGDCFAVHAAADGGAREDLLHHGHGEPARPRQVRLALAGAAALALVFGPLAVLAFDPPSIVAPYGVIALLVPLALLAALIGAHRSTYAPTFERQVGRHVEQAAAGLSGRRPVAVQDVLFWLAEHRHDAAACATAHAALAVRMELAPEDVASLLEAASRSFAFRAAPAATGATLAAT